jgi:hypothetical protein
MRLSNLRLGFLSSALALLVLLAATSAKAQMEVEEAVRSIILDDFMEEMNPTGMPMEPQPPPPSSGPDCDIDIDPNPLMLFSSLGLGDGGIQTATAVDVEGDGCVTAPVAGVFDAFLDLEFLGDPGLDPRNPNLPGQSYELFWGTNIDLVLFGDILCPIGCVQFGVVQFAAVDSSPGPVEFENAEVIQVFFPF